MTAIGSFGDFLKQSLPECFVNQPDALSEIGQSVLSPLHLEVASSLNDIVENVCLRLEGAHDGDDRILNVWSSAQSGVSAISSAAFEASEASSKQESFISRI